MMDLRLISHDDSLMLTPHFTLSLISSRHIATSDQVSRIISFFIILRNTHLSKHKGKEW